MEMVLCVGSGAAAGAVMVASQEAARRRREAFMRRGDQVLQQILAHPRELTELKRISRIPPEAEVWFILVHVGSALLGSKLEGGRFRIRVKNGVKTWSVKRDTPEADGLPTLLAAGVLPGSAAAGSAGDGTAASMRKASAVADFNSTCIFVMTHGLQPVLRFRLQRQHKLRSAKIWRTVAWAEIPISKEAQVGRATVEDRELLLMSSKALGRSAALLDDPRAVAESLGSVSVAVETRAVSLGELRSYGLGVGTVVAAPLPGQEDLGFIQGVPVQGALHVGGQAGRGQAQGPLVQGAPVVAGTVLPPANGAFGFPGPTRAAGQLRVSGAGRRARLRRRRLAQEVEAEELDSSSASDVDAADPAEARASSASDEDGGTPVSDDSDVSASSEDDDASAGAVMRRILSCKCR